MIGLLICASLLAQDCSVLKPQFTSTEMRKRAVHRVDISGTLKQADIKDETILDVMIAVDGTLDCLKSQAGHPLFRQEVERAVRLWKFKPLLKNGQPIPYAGRLHFVLCNISCGERGPSMTLLGN